MKRLKEAGNGLTEAFQPNGKRKQNCGGIRTGSFWSRNYDAEWHDNECGDFRGYICEK